MRHVNLQNKNDSIILLQDCIHKIAWQGSKNLYNFEDGKPIWYLEKLKVFLEFSMVFLINHKVLAPINWKSEWSPWWGLEISFFNLNAQGLLMAEIRGKYFSEKAEVASGHRLRLIGQSLVSMKKLWNKKMFWNLIRKNPSQLKDICHFLEEKWGKNHNSEDFIGAEFLCLRA